MPRIYYRKNSAETQRKIQRQIRNCSFEFYSSKLRFGQLCFTVMFFCSQRLQSLKDILIDFPDTPYKFQSI